MTSAQRARGFTLIELVITIVIIGVAVFSVVGAISASAARSAATMQRQQAASIANAYLAETLSMPFADPQLPDNEVVRNAFDDVGDYDGLIDNGVRGRDDVPIAALAAYTVSVRVVPVTLQPGNVAALRVTVTVQPTSGDVVIAQGYRTNHT